MPDITYLTVRNQLNAMACSHFEIGILDRVQSNMITRTYKKNDVLNSINWFKHQNSNNKEIFIRPHGQVGLIFFDDVTTHIIEKMKIYGHEPAISLESSPQNYQGWVRVSNNEIPNDLATQCAKVLVNKYNTDSNSADFRHFGRLAGFTNNKPEYINEYGQYPFVKLSARNGKLATNYQEIISQAKILLINKEKNIVNSTDFQQINNDNETAMTLARNKYDSVIEQYSNNPEYELNLNAVDWQVAKYLAENKYTYDVIFDCLLVISPNLDQRKGKGRESNYVERSLKKLFSL